LAIYHNFEAFGSATQIFKSGQNITDALSESVKLFPLLNEKQIATIALNNQMSKSDLFAALKKANLTREQRKNVAVQLELAGATGATTAATGAQTTATVGATGATATG